MADDDAPLEGVIVPRSEGPVSEYGHEQGQKQNARGAYKFDAIKKNTYVALIRRGVRRVRAAEYVGVGYNTIVRHMDKDPDFAEMVTEAEMARVDEVEEAMFREAIQGGNVTAQQVILYNRRSDEWADQRQIKARLEAAKAEAEAREQQDEHVAVDSLRDKLHELRARVTAPPAQPVNETAAHDDS